MYPSCEFLLFSIHTKVIAVTRENKNSIDYFLFNLTRALRNVWKDFHFQFNASFKLRVELCARAGSTGAIISFFYQKLVTYVCYVSDSRTMIQKELFLIRYVFPYVYDGHKFLRD